MLIKSSKTITASKGDLIFQGRRASEFIDIFYCACNAIGSLEAAPKLFPGQDLSKGDLHVDCTVAAFTGLLRNTASKMLTMIDGEDETAKQEIADDWPAPLQQPAAMTQMEYCAPPGWQFVPLNPTPAMIRAATALIKKGHEPFNWDVYVAMLSAAPKPPTIAEAK